jgi:hypothetical protein
MDIKKNNVFSIIFRVIMKELEHLTVMHSNHYNKAVHIGNNIIRCLYYVMNEWQQVFENKTKLVCIEKQTKTIMD